MTGEKTGDHTRDTNTQPRVGVFLCECGGEISDHVDLMTVLEKIQKIPGVSSVETKPYPCSPKGVQDIRQALRDGAYDRIVVAGCAPRLLLPLFQRALREEGKNVQLVLMADIREGCARVHRDDREGATAKACDIVRSTVARVLLRRPLPSLETEVAACAVVLGGGVAGLTAALDIADRGFEVITIEREHELGGLAGQWEDLYPIRVDTSVAEMVEMVTAHPKIEVLTGATVERVAGHVGNYEFTVKRNGREKTVTAGTVVVAVGSPLLDPQGLYGYGEDPRVITQSEFAARLAQGDLPDGRIVMIQCVGARIPERPYCSRFCCIAAMKNVLTIKAARPQADVTIVFRGLNQYIPEYEQVRQMGVRFIRYDPDRPPQVENGVVNVADERTGEIHELPYDLVVLAVPFAPRSEGLEIFARLGLVGDTHGFLVERQVRLRPETYAPSGVFVAGSAHWPVTYSEAVVQGHGAASRACALLSAGRISRAPIVIEIDGDTCRGCGECVDACAQSALTLVARESGIDRAEVDPFACKGCGVCAVVCPSGAITVPHLSDGEIQAALSVASEASNFKMQSEVYDPRHSGRSEAESRNPGS
jgi:heterodisulfide reductase subunit A